MTSQITRSAALVVSAALRDDDTSVGLILRTLPPDQVAEVAIASVTALAEILHDHIPPHAIRAGVTEAQRIAQTTATEGN
ncbi:hypothetical protein [Streptomyces mesophilus]|uniref:hypothetical protein n=1 Tax=Streptomyces mesophilus TaxID=1775132 RepID=UPI00332FEFEF